MQQSALSVAERAYSTDSLSIVANILEQNINAKAGKALFTKQTAITWQQIQQSMQLDEAAIEFLRYPKFSNNNYTDSVNFAAIVIRKKGEPVLVPLGSEAQVQWCMTGGKTDSKETNISKLYRSSIKGNINTGPAFTGDSLYNILWKPLMPYLAGVKVVSYAPDGLLHKIAFAALPTGAGTLLLDSFQLQQYSSVRQVAEKKNTQNTVKTALLEGYADFNAGSDATGNETWQILPATKKEIVTLQQLFQSKGINVAIDSGFKANEENFKAMSGNAPNILHIATHGFFLPDPPTQSADANSGATATSGNLFATSQDPLMRSGIILAGANKYWQGEIVPNGKDDGILTAFEIAQLNLQNTALAVLSACETGLGDVQDSEGVFGLQRALKMAGIKNMVLSLWQVPDEETMELMSNFYTRLLNGKNVRQSFYEAQKAMRLKYPPYSWAAFVLME